VSPLTPDHVNPERPWPQIDELARLTGLAGYTLHERLTAHPHFVREGEPWIDPAVLPHTLALADAYGLADEAAPVVGRPWRIRKAAERTSAPVFGDRAGKPGADAASGRDHAADQRTADRIRTVLAAVRRDPCGLDDADYAMLLTADGAELEALAAAADDVRRERVGDAITYVVNRNIDASLVRDASWPGQAETARTGDVDERSCPRTLSLELVTALADEAWGLGATEVCVQGRIADRMPASAYLDVIRAVRAHHPLHVHAYRPIELRDGAARADMPLGEYLAALRGAGAGSVTGTGARILDDRIRGILSGGTELPVATWVETVEAAHRAGLRSTATMVYGHIETPAQQVAHLRILAELQRRTGGFTEFIAMPFVRQDSPVRVPDSAADRPAGGASLRETRAVHAVARLMLAGSIDHVQAAWTKLGLHATRLVLAGGVDDLGGVLIDGALAPWAGAEEGRVLSVTDMQRIADEVARPLVQRTTMYGPVAS
jgi:FO synthase